VQLLLSIFIGWTILLSRVKADYSGVRPHASALIKCGVDASAQFGVGITAEIVIPARRRKVQLMKAATIVGILLIVLGIIGYATGGLSFTHEKKVVDAGPVQISRKTQDTLPLSPILSTVSLLAGLGLVVVGAKSK
jgi:peptidoglycan/LPS O-acetylase OafA/YrhL